MAGAAMTPARHAAGAGGEERHATPRHGERNKGGFQAPTPAVGGAGCLGSGPPAAPHEARAGRGGGRQERPGGAGAGAEGAGAGPGRSPLPGGGLHPGRAARKPFGTDNRQLWEQAPFSRPQRQVQGTLVAVNDLRPVSVVV